MQHTAQALGDGGDGNASAAPRECNGVGGGPKGSGRMCEATESGINERTGMHMTIPRLFVLLPLSGEQSFIFFFFFFFLGFFFVLFFLLLLNLTLRIMNYIYYKNIWGNQ